MIDYPARVRTLIAVALVATAAFAQESPMKSSSRTKPPAVTPVVVGLVRYEQDLALPGYLFARSTKNGELFFITQVYKQRLVAGREDGQVFFASMTHDAANERLTIVDEQKRAHQVSIREKERGSQWPAQVELVSAEPLKVKLTIPNPGTKVLELDEPSVCADGELSNSVFKLTADGVEVPYRGEMAKRAPPDSFIKVKPGKTFSVVVDLSPSFTVPKRGTLVIHFETTNHFSRDDVTLVSNELVVERK